MNEASQAPIVIARGALAAEAFLLAELKLLHAEARADWSLLATPVRVVVPSRSLRDHLAAQLVRALEAHAQIAAFQDAYLVLIALFAVAIPATWWIVRRIPGS